MPSGLCEFLKRGIRLGLVLAWLCLISGCGTAPPVKTAASPAQAPANLPARTLQKWNPVWWFGNADDPEPPDWYRPGGKCRRVLWQLRNPLHNFTFYVIGVADKPFTRTGKFPEAVFAPDGGWNWAVARHKWVRLPFISFNGKLCHFYFGWRERGNFGCKVNCGKLHSSDSKRETPDPAPPAEPK